MQDLPSLTRAEAEDRAALIHVDRYDVAIDLTSMLDGADFRAVASVRFSCRRPGATTFADAALTVVSATLNGVPVDKSRISIGRIQLTDLSEDNVLVVESVQSQTSHAEWVHRSVDPSDKAVYVWTSFEPDDARRAWVCFDQPDLKAPHRFTVTAPAEWHVVSNSADPIVTAVGNGHRQWAFPDTPPLSTYVPVIAAGAFHEIRSQRAGYDLGLLCRRSLARFLERDAEELFELTARGLIFFGDRFGFPFPQRKYDQVFLPDMGGAMENYGCVTWADSSVFRSPPTYNERRRRAGVLLHEMAHMWFGDIVTMTWWEDLWLNEAFAVWAAHWAAEAATPFTDAWSSFLVGGKLSAYAADMAPTTHPIRQPVEDVCAAVASFDAITYSKGASVLKQLFAFVGEEACVAGLRSYFAKHAWGNTRLSDLISELQQASGRDLDGWTAGWFDASGTDQLRLEAGEAGGHLLHAAGPNGMPPRPHRLNIGVYQRDESGAALVRRDVVSVETSGERTEMVDIGDAAILLVNDDDLTFASVRPDPATTRALLDSAHYLPSALSRALAVSTAWDMLMRGELPAADIVGVVVAVLRHHPADTLIEPYLSLVVDAADNWSAHPLRDYLLEQVADLCLELATQQPQQKSVIRALAETAITADQLTRLNAMADGDIDLQWRVLIRLAEIDTVDQAEVQRLVAQDPDPDAWIKALAVDAAKPDAQTKEAAWMAMVNHTVPVGSIGVIRRAFWRRSQGQILAQYADRYLDILPTLDRGGMIPAITLSAGLYPSAGVDEEFAQRAVAAAQSETVSPVVAKRVITSTDLLTRMLRTRAM
ncbi:aminopeptidase N [Rhizocola hellebori]|uniref:Aminopeptidase N n=1 Tax=Rhizocola hellebori TaxID=1392758 RepID=A0A8J3Q942_9ACTN|nr:aminopeptidase N [Rhizocola hellebori]GIH05315.1 aminopeptidase N [Rhizocola hellebori]